MGTPFHCEMELYAITQQGLPQGKGGDWGGLLDADVF